MILKTSVIQWLYSLNHPISTIETDFLEWKVVNLMSETFQAKPIEKTPLNQHVVNAIIEAIRNGKLNLGDKLPSETQLSKQFGVGRHVIREALRRLQELSIVTTETGRGTFVCQEAPVTLGPQAASLLLLGSVGSSDLFDFRLAIESYAAYFAALRTKSEDCEKLLHFLERMNNSKDYYQESNAFLDANFEFHKELVRLSGNQMYIVLYNTVLDLMDQLIKSSPYSHESTVASYEEHRQIYEAIIAHDAKRAFDTQRDHLLRLRKCRYDGKEIS